MDVHRRYITEDADARVRKYAAAHNIPLITAYREIIKNAVDENGNIISDDLGEVRGELIDIADQAGMSLQELVKKMVLVYSVIYSGDIPLYQAFRPINELADIAYNNMQEAKNKKRR